MKVLYPLGSFYPAQEGGPSNSVYWLTQLLGRTGIEPTVVTTLKGIERDTIHSGRRIDQHGVETYYFEYYGVHYVCPRLYLWLMKNIERYDLIHITSLLFPMSFLVVLLAVIKKVPFVISPRGELDANALCYHKWKKVPYLAATRRLFRKAVCFHATSQVEAAHVRRFFGEKVHCKIIPNGIKWKERVPGEIDIRRKFSLRNNQAYILSVGRIHQIKALENLIEAFAMINQDHLQLVIAGDADNDYGKQLQRLAVDLGVDGQIRFVGHVAGCVKQSLYGQAQLFVLPSHTENFGNVVVEALNRGVPVVASTGTPWKILEEYQCGYWVKNVPEELAHAMRVFLSMDEHCKVQYRKNAQRLVKERFSMGALIGQYGTLYREAAERTLTRACGLHTRN